MSKNKQYDNTNRGALFSNKEYKESRGKENAPDYTGSINANGEEFYISAWVRKANNKSFLSLSLTPKDANRKNAPNEAAVNKRVQAQEPPKDMDIDEDDDLPF